MDQLGEDYPDARYSIDMYRYYSGHAKRFSILAKRELKDLFEYEDIEEFRTLAE